VPIRPRHLAEQDFGPILDRLHESVVEGVRDYARENARQASRYRRNTRRSMVRDNIVDRLRASLYGRRGLHIRERNGTTYFGYLSRWQFHVRMLAEKSMGVALNRTQLAFSIQDNLDNAPLFGPLFQGTTKLYLGYVTPEDPEEVAVALVAPDGHRNAWVLLIDRPGASAIVPMLPSIIPPDEEVLVRVPEVKKIIGEEEANE
jgi:hypothetical protein